MPTAYIQQVAKDLKRPVSEIEKYWSKAKKIAAKKFDKKQAQYWAYVTGIFKNILGLNKSVSTEINNECARTVVTRIQIRLKKEKN
jgi:hypothetical protein